MDTPFDNDLEKMIIGNVLLSKSLNIAELQVSTVDFFFPPHQKIWGAIAELHEDKMPIEVMDIAGRVDDLKASELTKYAMGLPGDTRTSDVKRLKDLATLRIMMRAYSKFIDRAADKESVSELIDANVLLIEQVKAEQDARYGTSQHLVEVMEHEVFPRLDKFVSDEMVKVPFGFPALDSSTNGGAALGELVVFGSLPKSGKSVIQLQVARNIAEMGIFTLIASLEMLNYENGFRFLAQSSKYSMNVFRPKMYPETAEGLKAHARETYDIPLRLDHKVRTTKELAVEIQRLKDLEGLTCVFVDYVQLVSTQKRFDNRAAKIEEIIYDLKELAMRHEVVIYTAAQFNREGIKSDKPTMAHFDGSSAIEKAANLVLLWTLEKEFDHAVKGRRGKLWIEAGRSVAHDEFDIAFQGADAKFIFL